MEWFSCHVTVIILSNVCVYHHNMRYKHVNLYVHGSVMVFENASYYVLFTLKEIMARITYLMPVFAKQETNKDLLLFRRKCCARHAFLLVVQKVISIQIVYDDGTTTNPYYVEYLTMFISFKHAFNFLLVSISSFFAIHLYHTKSTFQPPFFIFFDGTWRSGKKYCNLFSLSKQNKANIIFACSII